MSGDRTGQTWGCPECGHAKAGHDERGCPACGCSYRFAAVAARPAGQGAPSSAGAGTRETALGLVTSANRSPEATSAVCRHLSGSGVLREQVARWLFEKVTRRDGLTRLRWEHLQEPQVTGWLEWADDLLATPALRRLLDAAAAVERVRAWAAMNDDTAREYDEAADAVTDATLVFGARERAEDCRAIAEGVRRALDGPGIGANASLSAETVLPGIPTTPERAPEGSQGESGGRE